jgi:lycopene beta-cyclase
MHDLIILGAGPAALAIAAATASRGLRIACIAPEWPAPLLKNTYGVWLDDLPADLRDLAQHVWSNPHATFTPGRPIDLARPYARIDNAALAARLMHQATDHDTSTQLIPATALRITHTHNASEVHTADAIHAAHLVLDATGASTRFIQREPGDDPGFQIAWGATIPGLDARLPAPMMLMDYTPLAAGPDTHPTFLYAMDMGDGRAFFEETTLVSRPALSLDVMRHRLALRLKNTLGVRLDELPVEDVERCVIPMGRALPLRTQRTFAYGAAAGMIHPASGYQLARALTWAPALADALAHAIQTDCLRGDRLSRAAWSALWTPDRLRQHALYRYGMEMLLGMDGDHLRAFFSTFFAQPQPRWSGFLSGTLSTPDLLAAMLHIFGASGPRTRLDLIRPALRGDLSTLLRGLVP